MRATSSLDRSGPPFLGFLLAVASLRGTITRFDLQTGSRKKRDGKPAAILPEIGQGLGEFVVHCRTTADSFDNDAIRKAIEVTGRKTILIAGVSTEVAVQLPALSGSDLGYRVFVVVDATAGISERTEEAAFRRIIQAGASTVSVATLSGELAGDFGQPIGQQSIGILFEMASGLDAET